MGGGPHHFSLNQLGDWFPPFSSVFPLESGDSFSITPGQSNPNLSWEKFVAVIKIPCYMLLTAFYNRNVPEWILVSLAVFLLHIRLYPSIFSCVLFSSSFSNGSSFSSKCSFSSGSSFSSRCSFSNEPSFLSGSSFSSGFHFRVGLRFRMGLSF